MAKLRVLIVDDERAVADSLGLIFQKCGFDCRVAYKPDEALTYARSFEPQLLLADLSMPGMGGLVMASLIAHELPDCRILMLTGDSQALEDAWSSGKTAFGHHSIVTKPIHPDALLREAHHLLNSAPAGFPAGVPIH